uniref:Platelet-derived growth factor D n=2 Tax=Equus TaxID=9789 RepID=A0A3Q2GYT0_HORSE
MSQSPLDKYWEATLSHSLLATLFSAPFPVQGRGLTPRRWEEPWPTVKLGMLSGRAGLAGPGRGSARAGLGWERACAQLGAPAPRRRTRLLRWPARAAAARPLQPVLQLLATGGGEQTSTCCLSRHHLSTLSTTRKCGTHTRSESSACRKFGESSAISNSGPASAGRAQRRERGVASVPEQTPAFSWSGAVPGSLIPMHRLILIYTLVCANFCSYRDTSAIPQSASIKALRSANLRRDDLYRRDETIQVTGNGHVQSPRFPNSYPRNLLLTWRLHSQEKTRIQLAFDNQFGLEEAENDICRYDFVEVEDISETSTIIRGRWCGHKEVPPRITSRTNQIKITFKSDDYFVAKPGFKIYYSFVEDFQPAAASETNWESVTSSISGVSYHSPSVTDPTLTADALDKTVAEFDTVEDLLKHFNPESWQEDLENLYLDTPHYRGRSYHDRKSKVDLDRLNDDVKRYSCTPRNYSVNLREELKLTNVVFFPRCLLVQRCGGNCGCGTVNWKSCTCNSGKTVKKYHEVLKFEPGHFKRRSRAKHMALVDIQLDHHERCDCICSSRPPR